jgi:hypothetical protein
MELLTIILVTCSTILLIIIMSTILLETILELIDRKRANEMKQEIDMLLFESLDKLKNKSIENEQKDTEN